MVTEFVDGWWTNVAAADCEWIVLFVSFFVTCENWCRYVVRMQYVRTSYVDYDNEMKWDVFVTNSYYRELKNGQ